MLNVGKAWLYLLILVVPLGGCAYIDQNLRVAPQPAIYASDIGKGKKVALRVIDDRDEQIIGKRGAMQAYAAAKITTDQDLADVLREVFLDGLRKRGFEPVGYNDSDLSLKVELRSLAYDTSMGFWTGGNIGKATLKVVATNPSGGTYENAYRGQEEIRTAFIGSQETNAKVVNDALNGALERAFADQALWEFLAG